MEALSIMNAGERQFSFLDKPEPKPKPAQVLIEIYGTTVCGTEVHAYEGHLKMPLKYPYSIGHEYSGVIVEMGEDVRDLKLGDRVIAESSAGCEACRYCRNGLTNLCTNRSSIAGSFTRFVAVDARYVYRLPDHISLRRATLSEPLACVINGLIDQSTIHAGDLVVIIGPGPIGLLAAILAEEMGAEVVLIGRSSSRVRLELASRQLELPHVIDTDAIDAVAFVRELDAMGADVVIDAAGGAAAVNLGFDLVRKGGAFIELALFNAPAEVDFEKILFKQIRINGAVSHRPKSWQKLLQFYMQNRLRKAEQIISHEYPLEKWEEAFEVMVSREATKSLIISNSELT